MKLHLCRFNSIKYRTLFQNKFILFWNNGNEQISSVLTSQILGCQR